MKPMVSPSTVRESRASAAQIAEASIHPHRGQEIDQQKIARLEIEQQLRAAENMHNRQEQCHQQST